MNAIAIGPFLLSMARFAAILAAVAFLLTAWAVSRRIDRRLMDWAMWVIVAFVAGARAGHVLANVASFGTEPLRVFALWQGGFSWPAGLIAVVLVTILYWRNIRLIALTGYGLAEDQRRVLEAGFDLHLVKPVDMRQLLEALGERRACAANAAQDGVVSESGK